MLSKGTVNRLKQLGIQATQAQDFVSGLKLMQLVCQIFYRGQNQSLSSKLRLSDQHKTGNNVLNVNIILNHLKKDQALTMENDIKQLTAFKLIEDTQAMIKFVEWLLNNKSQHKNAVSIEMSPPREHQNQFQNLYFVSSLEKKNHPINDSLEQDNEREKVVRKGSFKVLKPKIGTQSKSMNQQNQKMHAEIEQFKHLIKEPLKEVYILNNNSEQQDREQLNCRKTVPKMQERPPLYRSKQKDSNEKIKQSVQFKEEKISPNFTSRPTDREEIFKNIENISNQIIQQERSLTKINNQYQNKSIKKSVKKIFKLQLPQVDDKIKKSLMQWLIGINLLSSNSSRYIHELQNICKDGVIFNEIINYYRGRGKQMCFFKQPKRSAEIHSNYQKIFAIMKDIPEFNSQLTNQYEYFVPEAQPNAFWNFLYNLYLCFHRQLKPKDPNINRYQNSISRKVERQSSKRKLMHESISYNQIKFNSNSSSKEHNKEVRTNFSSVELPRKQTPKPRSTSKDRLEEKENTIIAPYGLVQNQEPAEQIFKTERGYKEMYLCKFKNMETPQKNKSFMNNSLTKSKRKASGGSVKKNQAYQAIPSVSLQMQMKVLKYLRSYHLDQENAELFKDPFRNGVLLCMIIKKQLGIDCFASKKPKSIQDCRNNFIVCIQAMKSKKINIACCYQNYIEQLVKGQKSLLYGVIWNLIKDDDSKNRNYCEMESNHFIQDSQTEEWVISWVRSIERNCPEIAAFKIRNEPALHSAITNTDFLFFYSWLITGKKAVTPNYQRPVNIIQKESNLKKVLGYLIQNKIIKSNYLWKTKSIAKNEGNTLNELVKELITHFNHLNKKEQIRTVNFVKYVKRENSQSQEKPAERLETTMANQTIHQTQIQASAPKIQINWMRKLGFTGNLQLNNGVILCRLVSKMNMKTIDGVNQNPQSRAQCLGNIRRAIKEIPKFKWDEYDVSQCGYEKTLQIYSFLKQKYKHSYAMKAI